uniref:Uncharacterized protein n=1 Tax=Anopheles culicifacies TaxID=139723 RepID=A0A182LWU0_9DIPT
MGTTFTNGRSFWDGAYFVPVLDRQGVCECVRAWREELSWATGRTRVKRFISLSSPGVKRRTEATETASHSGDGAHTGRLLQRVPRVPAGRARFCVPFAGSFGCCLPLAVCPVCGFYAARFGRIRKR